ncbi:MAG: hypothetical protein ABJB17_02890 [Burkholderiales bacterium]
MHAMNTRSIALLALFGLAAAVSGLRDAAHIANSFYSGAGASLWTNVAGQVAQRLD